MANLARGICLPGIGLRPLAARTEFTAVHSRLFSTSFRLRAAEPTVRAARTPAPVRNVPKPVPSTSVAPSRYAFMKSLATKTSPTILYESPSHFWFYFGCWTSGISILSWTALTAPTAMTQPEDVPQWVGLVFGASYVLLGSMGAYLITKTPNIVSRIRVLPAVQMATKAAAPGAAVSAHAPLQMEVTVKRMIPVLNPKVITVPLEKVSLKTRFSLPEEYVPELKRQELQRAELSKRKAQRKFDMEHLMTMPFRQISRAFAGMFNGIKSAWTDMGYGVIKVDGKSYKVDVTKGFAHDGFRTLEKLVDIKP